MYAIIQKKSEPETASMEPEIVELTPEPIENGKKTHDEPTTPEFEIGNPNESVKESTELIEIDEPGMPKSPRNEETITPEPMQEVYIDEEPTPEHLDEEYSQLSPPLIEIDEDDDECVFDESISSTPDQVSSTLSGTPSPPATPPSYDRCKTCKQILQDLPTFDRNSFTEEYGEGKEYFKNIYLFT